MADAPVAEESPWTGVWVILAILGGCLVLLYMNGGLSKLNGKDLFLPATSTPQALVPEGSGGTTYAKQELEHSYTIDPNPVQTTNPNAQ